MRRRHPIRSATALTCMLAAAAVTGGCQGNDGHQPAAAPVDSTSDGAAPVGSTTYPAPAGALFVASTGNDQATGTERDPLRTLSAAVAKAPMGGTVVLRGGVYHESVKVPAGRRLTIQSAPHEAVWLDGSSPVTGWRQENGVWVHDGWTARFDSSPTYASGAAPSADPKFQFVSPERPMAAHPDQLWFDGSPQAQVASRGEVRSGTFYVDEAARRLYVGSDPHGHDVRASTLGRALVLRAGRSILRGIVSAGMPPRCPNWEVCGSAVRTSRWKT